MSLTIDRKSGWQDWARIVLAVLLFISPWVFQFTSAPEGGGSPLAAWNAWICGLIVAALAVAALLRFAEWEEWLSAAVGAWMVASPWLLGYEALTNALWSAVILGALITATGAWKAIESHRRSQQATA